jgi:hypothetical protein
MSVSAFPHATSATGQLIRIDSLVYTDTSTSPADARVEVRFNASRAFDVLRAAGVDQLDLYKWLKYGDPADWEIRCTLASGTLSAGSSATGVWLSLASSRLWGAEKTSGAGIAQASIEIEIRLAATQLVYASALGVLTANVEL